MQEGVVCVIIVSYDYVTVHTPLFREGFWHEYAKIPLPQAIWNEFWLRY